MIPQETIERVRERADIAEIIGEHVKLRRAGRNLRGPCPLHGGTNPNFSVSPDKGLYHCFTCGESGTVFTFLEKVLGVDYPTAVRMVAERVGVEIVETNRRSEERDTREPLWEANAAAAELYAKLLWDTTEATVAREYLESRQIPRALAERFGIGYAPRGRVTQERLNALGYDDERLLEAGLLVRREGSDEPYPRFRDRLMFPILDLRGRHVGFGGRVLDSESTAAKYLNSPESRAFAKRGLLYNLHQARNAIRKEDRVLVVEGYVDVVRLVGAGVEPVVAGLGTALTEEHAALIAKYTKNVFLLYDSDEAGQKATFRAGLELLRASVAPRVVTLPEGEDPDSFVAKRGRAALEAQLDSAIDLFERQIQILERKGWFAELHRRRRAIDKLLPTIRATSDPLTRDIYVSRLSVAAGVDKELVVREVANVARRTAGRAGAGRSPDEPPRDESPIWADGAQGGPPDESFQRGAYGGRGKLGKRRGFGRRQEDGWRALGTPPRARPRARSIPEEQLTAAMLTERSLVPKLLERFPPERFRDAHYRAIYETLVRLGADAMADEVEAVLATPDAAVLHDLLDRAPEMLNTADAGTSLQEVVDACIAQLRVRELDERSAQIDADIVVASDEEKDRLLLEKKALGDEKRALNGRAFRTLRRR